MKGLGWAGMALMGVLIAIPAWGQQGNPEAGRNKTSMCSGCHEIPGYRTVFPKVYSVPKLGGQHAEYIVGALKAYQEHQRANTTMQAIAAGLSDQDVADVAAFYAGEPRK